MNETIRTGRAALAVAMLTLLGGCAGLQPLPPGAGPTPSPPTPRAATARPGDRATATPQAIPIDTVPSRDAMAVLGSIPEPLPATERTAPPPRRPAGASPDTADFVGHDASAPDSGATDVPVPSPTEPLGSRPRPVILPPDSAAAAPAPGSNSPAQPAVGPPPAAPAPGAAQEACWRVQIAAPNERAKAERYLAAAESQLVVPVVIERENGLFKVRTRDCVGEAGAEALKRRALDSGFTGAFRFQAKRP